MNRREFLSLSASLGVTSLASVGAADSAKGRHRAPTGPVRLTAGVFSDLHITDAASTGIVEKALRQYRSANVDVVVCTGDVANTGQRAQLDLFEATWEKVFPGGKGADGKTVERVFITGNHDIGIMGRHTDKKNILHHETFLGEPLVPAFVKTVKGYTFICQNWRHGAEARALIEAQAPKLRGEKPFFYLQHSHLRGTIPYAWLTDNGQTTTLLKKFPNCVALTGHSHWPLVDERSLWQGEFTALNCGCLRTCCPTGGRENVRTFGEVDPKTSQMPVMAMRNDAQAAMIMKVYDDAIVFSRWDVKNALSLGADWIVPWPISSGGKVSAEARAKSTPAPQFAAGAKVGTRRGTGTNRAGKTVEQLFVEFPNCRVMDGSPARALDFEVALEARTFDIVRPTVVKRVYSRGFYRAEAKDEPTVVCAFGLGELPVAPVINDGPKRVTAAYRFAVRPCNSFGATGLPIHSPWIKLEGALA